MLPFNKDPLGVRNVKLKNCGARAVARRTRHYWLYWLIGNFYWRYSFLLASNCGAHFWTKKKLWIVAQAWTIVHRDIVTIMKPFVAIGGVLD